MTPSSITVYIFTSSSSSTSSVEHCAMRYFFIRKQHSGATFSGCSFFLSLLCKIFVCFECFVCEMLSYFLLLLRWFHRNWNPEQLFPLSIQHEDCKFHVTKQIKYINKQIRYFSSQTTICFKHLIRLHIFLPLKLFQCVVIIWLVEITALSYYHQQTHFGWCSRKYQIEFHQFSRIDKNEQQITKKTS